jgi:hypothetical protein
MIFMAVLWLVLVGSRFVGLRLAVVLLLLLLWLLWRPPLLLLWGRILHSRRVLVLSRVDWLLQWLLGIRGRPRTRIRRFWRLLLLLRWGAEDLE